MKKAITLILALCIVLLACACGQSSESATKQYTVTLEISGDGNARTVDSNGEPKTTFAEGEGGFVEWEYDKTKSAPVSVIFDGTELNGSPDGPYYSFVMPGKDVSIQVTFPDN